MVGLIDIVKFLKSISRDELFHRRKRVEILSAFFFSFLNTAQAAETIRHRE